MTLHQTQKIIAKDRTRFRILRCGRRWGKTTLAVEEIKGKALSKARRIAYIAPTFQQARDIAWQMLVTELNSIIKKTNESRLELTVRTLKDGESLIQLRGWEAIETLRGQKFDFIVIDEVASMRNFWLNWEEVIRPTLTDTRGEVMFISTPKGFNHFYDLSNLENDDADYKSFHFTSYDNPFLPVDELDKAKQELTEDRFGQEYLADFRKTEGLVYKEFSRDRHLYTDLREGIVFNQILAGVDFGYTNPACALKIGVDYDNRFWVEEEWYKTQQTDEQIVEATSLFKPNIVYPDPNAPDKIEKMRQKGLNVRDVNKNKDSIATGINIIRELFKQNRLFIHKDCKNLIWELETYHYPDKKSEINEVETPVKDNDHAVDALRYALMTYLPERPVSIEEQFEILQNRNDKRSFR